ncbi:MAG: hypothetical protein WDM81_02305 [Rhizomicrobium sp.]
MPSADTVESEFGRSFPSEDAREEGIVVPAVLGLGQHRRLRNVPDDGDAHDLLDDPDRRLGMRLQLFVEIVEEQDRRRGGDDARDHHRPKVVAKPPAVEQPGRHDKNQELDDDHASLCMELRAV